MQFLIPAYIFLALVVGLLGKKTPIGFWGSFILSLFLTPLIPLIFVLIVQNNSPKNA